MSAVEKIYFESNTLIVMNWKLSLSKIDDSDDRTNNNEEQFVDQKTVLDKYAEWSFSSIVYGVVGMYCGYYYDFTTDHALIALK